MRLAIIGASARAAAMSALSAGFDVVAADLFADADLASRCSATKIADWPHGFGPWLADTECDGWLMTGGVENYPDLVEEWSHIRPLLGVDAAALRLVRAPGQLAELLLANGLRFPTTHAAFPKEPLTGEWLVKSLRSAGGWGVQPWQPGKSIVQGDEVLQQWIEGIPISAVYVTSGETTTCWGMSRQLIAPPWTHATGFKYAGSIGPVSLPSETRSQVEQAGMAIALAVGMVGVWGIDFVLAEDGTPWVIEVNPRYTASMEVVERATGRSAIGLHLAAFGENASLPRVTQSDEVWGKAYLFAPCDVRPGHDFTKHLHEFAAEVRSADLPYPGEPIAKGMPVTTLLARGADVDEVELQLERGLNELTARLIASDQAGSPPTFPAGEARS